MFHGCHGNYRQVFTAVVLTLTVQPVHVNACARVCVSVCVCVGGAGENSSVIGIFPALKNPEEMMQVRGRVNMADEDSSGAIYAD